MGYHYHRTGIGRIEGYGIEKALVVAGQQLNPQTNKTVQRKIKRYIKHSDYENHDLIMDYGLIEIADPLELGAKTNIWPTCLLIRELDDFDYGLLLVTRRGRSQRLYLPEFFGRKAMNETSEIKARTRDGRQFAYVKRRDSRASDCGTPFLICFASDSAEICSGDSGGCLIYNSIKSIVLMLTKIRCDRVLDRE